MMNKQQKQQQHKTMDKTVFVEAICERLPENLALNRINSKSQSAGAPHELEPLVLGLGNMRLRQIGCRIVFLSAI